VSLEHAGSSVAVVTGLLVEARCLRGLKVRTACSGGSAERARAEAMRLIADGATALVSFGLAGGLAPELRPGDLVLPETVRLPEGQSIATDSAWRQRLSSRLEAGGVPPVRGALAGSERVVATPSDKRMLFGTTGARAVDMESHRVAQVARSAGIPFVVIRAIADPADRVIPQPALEALRPDGRIRIPAVLGGMIRQPGVLIALVRLGRDTATALTTLRRAAVLSGALLACDRGV
jgi:adenosylhomocysteine nucleosidase